MLVPNSGLPGTGNDTQPAGSGNGNPPNTGNNGNGAQAPGQQPPQQQQPVFSIDPRYSNLPPAEAFSRTMQGIVTPLHQKISDYEKDKEKWNAYAESLAELMDPTKKDLRLAFIRELEPDLIQPLDIEDEVQAKLDKKYGADFKYDPEEAKNDRRSQSARFARDEQRFFKEAEESRKNSPGSKTYSELKKDVQKKQKERADADMQQITDLRTKYRLSDSQVTAFQSYAKKLTIEDLYLHYVGIQNFNPTGNINSIGGSNVSPDDKWAKVEKLFGPPRPR